MKKLLVLGGTDIMGGPLSLRFRQPDFDPVKHGWMRWQMKYARLLHRIYDTTRMLDTTGLKQEQFLPLHDGLSLIKRTVTDESSR